MTLSRSVFIIAFIGHTGFQIGSALAPNTASLLVFRFLSGAFGAWYVFLSLRGPLPQMYLTSSFYDLVARCRIPEHS